MLNILHGNFFLSKRILNFASLHASSISAKSDSAHPKRMTERPMFTVTLRLRSHPSRRKRKPPSWASPGPSEPQPWNQRATTILSLVKKWLQHTSVKGGRKTTFWADIQKRSQSSNGVKQSHPTSGSACTKGHSGFKQQQNVNAIQLLLAQSQLLKS